MHSVNPADPGLAAVSRHALLLALWSGAHLVARGNLVHALVFGGFLAKALVAMAAVAGRSDDLVGADAARLAIWREGLAARIAAGRFDGYLAAGGRFSRAS